MDKKKLATIGAICAAAAIIGALLPWYSISMAGRSMSVSGTGTGMNGTWVLILCALGGAAALVFMLGKADALPLDEKALLFVGALLCGIGAILTLADFLRDFGPASRGIGIILSLAGSIAATVFCLLAAMKAKAGN